MTHQFNINNHSVDFFAQSFIIDIYLFDIILLSYLFFLLHSSLLPHWRFRMMLSCPGGRVVPVSSDQWPAPEPGPGQADCDRTLGQAGGNPGRILKHGGSQWPLVLTGSSHSVTCHEHWTVCWCKHWGDSLYIQWIVRGYNNIANPVFMRGVRWWYQYDGNTFDPDSSYCVLPLLCDLGHEAGVWWALHPGHSPPVRWLARVSVRQHSEQSEGM